MQAVRLFWHSVRQVFGNFAMALRISLGPLAIAAAATFLLFIWILHRVAAVKAHAAGPAYDSIGVFIGIPFVVVLWFATVFWIAIGWHRYVLRLERPVVVFPRWHGRRLLAYFGRTTQVSLLLFLAAIPVLLCLVLPLVLFPSSFAPALSQPVSLPGSSMFLVAPLFAPKILIQFILGIAALWFSFRVAPMLPAAALGEEMPLRWAWIETTGQNWTFLGLAALVGVSDWLISESYLVLSILHQGAILQVWMIVAGWARIMVSISLLTTIYGHYVEKRPLVSG